MRRESQDCRNMGANYQDCQMQICICYMESCSHWLQNILREIECKASKKSLSQFLLVVGKKDVGLMEP